MIIINRGKLVANDKLSNLRLQVDSNNLLKVTFKEPLEAAWLERLNSVQSVNKISTNEWELVCHDATETKRQLLELALQHNLNIVSLQSGGQSLEDVFRSLTNTTAWSLPLKIKPGKEDSTANFVSLHSGK